MICNFAHFINCVIARVHNYVLLVIVNQFCVFHAKTKVVPSRKPQLMHGLNIVYTVSIINTLQTLYKL